MSRLILPFFTLLFCSTFSIQAQITIDENNFGRGTGYLDSSYIADPTGIVAPTEGADQLWDYSSLPPTRTVYREIFDATDNTVFPEANSYFNSNQGFPGLTFPTRQYTLVDEKGWRLVGVSSTAISYPIGAITGSPTDSLKYPDFEVDANSSYLQFPLTYQTQFAYAYSGTTPFELTVAGFGLNQVPGAFNYTTTVTREVTGYGNLIIPKPDGTPSAPIEVLLVKSTIETMDSIFLGGAPAPAPLLAAFGLTQGQLNSQTDYAFYGADLGSSILFINPASSIVDYRPQHAVPTCTAPTDFTVDRVAPKVNKISWNSTEGAQQYVVQIRYKGTDRWLVTAKIKAAKVSVSAPADRVYEYRVATMCEGVLSDYSPIEEFNTLGSIIEQVAQSRNGTAEAIESITLEDQNFKAFPNPVEAGMTINIQLDQPIANGQFQLSTINGQLIQVTSFTAVANQQLSIPIPTTANSGLYIYQVYDEAGKAIGRGKLQVN